MGLARDQQVTADLNTVRAWQRKLQTGTLNWPLEASVWDGALGKGRGRGPYDISKHWRTGLDDYKLKWDSARAPLAEVAQKRPDLAGLETGLSTQTFRHLNKCSNKRDDRTPSAVNADLGGVWHEVRTHCALTLGPV
eukprot:5364571-Amphidinium_carterae.3